MNYIMNKPWVKQHIVEDSELPRERVTMQGKVALEKLCQYYGSSYDGRRKAAMKFLHIKQMVPILISQEKSLIVFPTQGSDDVSCIWINYSNLCNMVALDERRTLFVFQDEEQLVVHMEYRSACIQVQRCSLFLYMMGCHQNSNLIEVLHQSMFS